MPDDTKPKDNVLSVVGRLKSVAGEPKPMVTLTKAPFCYPHRFNLNMATRTVSCAECRTAFDPIDALTELFKSWPDYAANRKLLKEELASIETKIREARQELSNVRAAVKRWRAKEGGTT